MTRRPAPWVRRGEHIAAEKLGVEIVPIAAGFPWLSERIEEDRAPETTVGGIANRQRGSSRDCGPVPGREQRPQAAPSTEGEVWRAPPHRGAEVLASGNTLGKRVEIHSERARARGSGSNAAAVARAVLRPVRGREGRWRWEALPLAEMHR